MQRTTIFLLSVKMSEATGQRIVKVMRELEELGTLAEKALGVEELEAKLRNTEIFADRANEILTGNLDLVTALPTTAEGMKHTVQGYGAHVRWIKGRYERLLKLKGGTDRHGTPIGGMFKPVMEGLYTAAESELKNLLSVVVSGLQSLVLYSFALSLEKVVEVEELRVRMGELLKRTEKTTAEVERRRKEGFEVMYG